MDIKIINEKNGNPFRYFPEDGDKHKDSTLYYPRAYKKQETVQKVMDGLLKKLGLEKDIDCLEIGAGHNPKPSQALSDLGAEVTTLDADWEPDRHTDLKYKDYKKLEKKLGNNLVIPRLAGKNENVFCYLGDVAFLNDKKSELKDKTFDLIYFFGSLNYDGFCRCIEDSSASKELGIKINFSNRLLPIVSSLKENGKILATASHFSGYMPESEELAGAHNADLAEIALYYALGTERKAKSMGILVQTPGSVMKTLDITSFSEKQQQRLLKDPFERIIQNNWESLFGKDNDYQNLKKTLDKLGYRNRKKFTNLGLIDSVFIEY